MARNRRRLHRAGPNRFELVMFAAQRARDIFCRRRSRSTATATRTRVALREIAETKLDHGVLRTR